MKKFKYVDEETFTEEIVKFTEEFVMIAEQLNEYSGNHGPIIVGKDKKSLCFPIDISENRKDKESGKHLYIITIRKYES